MKVLSHYESIGFVTVAQSEISEIDQPLEYGPAHEAMSMNECFFR